MYLFIFRPIYFFIIILFFNRVGIKVCMEITAFDAVKNILQPIKSDAKTHIYWQFDTNVRPITNYSLTIVLEHCHAVLNTL